MVDAATDFDCSQILARSLLRRSRQGALVLDGPQRRSYCSLANVRQPMPTAPRFCDFAPGAAHPNILGDARISLIGTSAPKATAEGSRIMLARPAEEASGR